jgi:peptidyl-prolyl cis-trans isomerase A (cyclophilin A)
VIAGLKTRFGEVPIDNYTDSDLENKVAITDDNLVVITDIVVIDPAVVTNSGLNPIPNTLINSSSQGDDSGGGGSVFWLALMALCSIQLRRCFK